MVRKESKKKVENEKIITVPTFFNISRIILTFVVIYMIITDTKIVNIVIVFSIAALTDWFDGFIARKYGLVNEFGAKADMLADRFLWIGTSVALFVVFGLRGRLDIFHGVQLLLIMSREVITAPSAVVAFFEGGLFPRARYIAKITTFVQGFAIPALMLSVFYPKWIYLSLPLSIFIGVSGTISGLYYMRDVQEMRKEKIK